MRLAPEMISEGLRSSQTLGSPIPPLYLHNLFNLTTSNFMATAMSGAINSLNDLLNSLSSLAHQTCLDTPDSHSPDSLEQSLSSTIFDVSTNTLTLYNCLPDDSLRHFFLHCHPACLGYDLQGFCNSHSSFRKLVPKPHTFVPGYRIV